MAWLVCTLIFKNIKLRTIQTVAQILAPSWRISPQGCSAGWLSMVGGRGGIPRKVDSEHGRWRMRPGGRYVRAQRLASCVVYECLLVSSCL